MKTKNAVLSVIIAALIIPLIGCGTLDPSGTYGGDKPLYISEVAQPTCYKLVQTFLKWELDYRDTLIKQNPGVKKFADKIRREYPDWNNTASRLHDAYIASPTEENQLALVRAINVLKAAAAEANAYMLNSLAE